jgi:hypothetical protein
MPGTGQQTTSSGELHTYFGCWLDFNQVGPSLFPRFPGVEHGPFTTPLFPIQQLIRGRHQCLTVEIVGDLIAPVDGSTPFNTDKLAQKNLSIVDSDNPGSAASHTVQQTFVIRAARPPVKQERIGVIAEMTRADEVIFDWRGLPRGTQVTLQFPDVDGDVDDFLLARRFGPRTFQRVDRRTLRTVIEGDAAWLPIPRDRTRDHKLLITMQLPDGIRAGQIFRAIVKQIDARRDVAGAAELRIDVRHAPEILGEAERTLGVLRHIDEAIPSDDRWKQVMDTYVAETAARVAALGGDPALVPPSPYGGPDDHPSRCTRARLAFAKAIEALFRGDLTQAWHYLVVAIRSLVDCFVLGK